MQNKTEPRTLSGFMELLPEEQILFDQIKETIESVQNQSYTDWELLLVDDMSTDNSANIIKRYIHQEI